MSFDYHSVPFTLPDDKAQAHRGAWSTWPNQVPGGRVQNVTLGERAMVDAAGVIGDFQRMVKIADSTGIPVDGFMAEASADVRETLGLNNLPSARLRD